MCTGAAPRSRRSREEGMWVPGWGRTAPQGMARQAELASPEPPGVPAVSPRDTGHQGTRRRASCWPLVRFRAAHQSKPSGIAPLLGVSRLAVQTSGRVPGPGVAKVHFLAK